MQLDRNRAEVAIQHRVAGHELRTGGDRHVFDRRLIISKDEQLVVLDGSADGAAELVPLERIGHVSEKVSRVQSVIAQKLKAHSVPLIRSRSGGNADHSSGS